MPATAIDGAGFALTVVGHTARGQLGVGADSRVSCRSQLEPLAGRFNGAGVFTCGPMVPLVVATRAPA